jgi:hypothetical protein
VKYDDDIEDQPALAGVPVLNLATAFEDRCPGYFVADAVQHTPMDIRCRRGHPGKLRRTHGDPPREIRVKLHGDNPNILPICIWLCRQQEQTA